MHSAALWNCTDSLLAAHAGSLVGSLSPVDVQQNSSSAEMSGLGGLGAAAEPLLDSSPTGGATQNSLGMPPKQHSDRDGLHSLMTAARLGPATLDGGGPAPDGSGLVWSAAPPLSCGAALAADDSGALNELIAYRQQHDQLQRLGPQREQQAEPARTGPLPRSPSATAGAAAQLRPQSAAPVLQQQQEQPQKRSGEKKAKGKAQPSSLQLAQWELAMLGGVGWSGSASQPGMGPALPLGPFPPPLPCSPGVWHGSAAMQQQLPGHGPLFPQHHLGPMLPQPWGLGRPGALGAQGCGPAIPGFLPGQLPAGPGMPWWSAPPLDASGAEAAATAAVPPGHVLPGGAPQALPCDKPVPGTPAEEAQQRVHPEPPLKIEQGELGDAHAAPVPAEGQQRQRQWGAQEDSWHGRCGAAGQAPAGSMEAEGGAGGAGQGGGGGGPEPGAGAEPGGFPAGMLSPAGAAEADDALLAASALKALQGATLPGSCAGSPTLRSPRNTGPPLMLSMLRQTGSGGAAVFGSPPAGRRRKSEPSKLPWGGAPLAVGRQPWGPKGIPPLPPQRGHQHSPRHSDGDWVPGAATSRGGRGGRGRGPGRGGGAAASRQTKGSLRRESSSAGSQDSQHAARPELAAALDTFADARGSRRTFSLDQQGVFVKYLVEREVLECRTVKLPDVYRDMLFGGSNEALFVHRASGKEWLVGTNPIKLKWWLDEFRIQVGDELALRSALDVPLLRNAGSTHTPDGYPIVLMELRRHGAPVAPGAPRPPGAAVAGGKRARSAAAAAAAGAGKGVSGGSGSASGGVAVGRPKRSRTGRRQWGVGESFPAAVAGAELAESWLGWQHNGSGDGQQQQQEQQHAAPAAEPGMPVQQEGGQQEQSFFTEASSKAIPVALRMMFAPLQRKHVEVRVVTMPDEAEASHSQQSHQPPQQVQEQHQHQQAGLEQEQRQEQQQAGAAVSAAAAQQAAAAEQGAVAAMHGFQALGAGGSPKAGLATSLSANGMEAAQATDTFAPGVLGASGGASASGMMAELADMLIESGVGPALREAFGRVFLRSFDEPQRKTIYCGVRDAAAAGDAALVGAWVRMALEEVEAA